MILKQKNKLVGAHQLQNKAIFSSIYKYQTKYSPLTYTSKLLRPAMKQILRRFISSLSYLITASRKISDTGFSNCRNHYKTRDRDVGMSICHINLARNPKLRGGERQTELLVRALANQGVTHQCIIILRRGPLTSRFQDCPYLKVFKVRNRLSALFVCLARSNKALLHAHETHAVQVAYLASLCSRKYIVTRRVINPIRKNPFSYAMYRNAHTVVALTKAVKDSIKNSTPNAKIVCIPSAWNPESPSVDTVQEIRDKFLGKFLVGYAGAMDDSSKGHSVLIQSARLLQSSFPDIKFILLGSGRLEHELRQQASDLNNVHFTGWVENPASWIAALDLFAFPSLREGLGSVLLDVMRAGCPVVASKVGGIPEVVTKNCGILVPPNDPEALAEQMAHLYQSHNLRVHLARAGAIRSEHYSPVLMAQRYKKVYLSAR